MARLRELSDVVLPGVAASGRLGDDVTFVECVEDQSESGQAQFASSVCFVTAVFQSRARGVFQQDMIVKYNMDNKAVRDWLKLDFQFRNEVFVYEKVLPFLDKGGEIIGELFPKCFYGSADVTEDPSKYIIILEDLRGNGFNLSPSVLDLDFQHCALAFKKLGAFHALSFIAKQSNSQAFNDISSEIIETKLFEDSREDAAYLYASTLDRAALPLLKRGVHVDEIHRFKNKLKDSYGYLAEVVAVQEPMGVICHGDFCRNNVLYKYNNNGEPVDIKLFDLATARYGSPMLDFTFFLFLNSSHESRSLNKEKYLNIYYDSLVANAKGFDLPSLEDFREELRLKAVYGFLICSFFKPAMMDKVPFDPVLEVQKSVEERGETVLKKGGDKGTEVISNMLQELIESKCEL